MTLYVIDSAGDRELAEGFYVVHDGDRKAVRKGYIIDSNGDRKRFWGNVVTKSWSESLSAGASPSLLIVRKIDEQASASLSDVWSRNATAFPTVTKSWSESLSATASGSITKDILYPSSLNAIWDGTNSEVDLNWDADDSNSQDIYRCPSDSCDPVASGTKIADVAAGVSSYSDPDPSTGDGSYSYQVKSTRGESNIATVTIPS